MKKGYRDAKDILVIGDINVDIVGKIDRLPSPGNCVFGPFPKISMGGTGANTALVLHKLGLRVAFLTAVGKDMFGEFLIENLKKQGIDVSLVRKIRNHGTGMIIALVDRNGERSFIAFRLNCADIHIKLDDHLQKILQSMHFKALFICGPMVGEGLESYETALRIAKYCNERGISVFFDPNIRTPTGSVDEGRKKCYLEILRYVDIFLPNKQELLAIFGNGDISITAKKVIKDYNIREIWLKMGDLGSMLISREQLVRIPAKKVKVVDTTGAGDVFNAGVIYGILKGWNAEKTGKYASELASICVGKTGGISAFITQI
ncbi:MAG: hypothetical protein DRP25_01410 [Thermotoga sp.]|nr:MAG: hypothetical protein DRP25_01410 [Thermotoga sp.]